LISSTYASRRPSRHCSCSIRIGCATAMLKASSGIHPEEASIRRWTFELNARTVPAYSGFPYPGLRQKLHPKGVTNIRKNLGRFTYPNDPDPGRSRRINLRVILDYETLSQVLTGKFNREWMFSDSVSVHSKGG